MLPVLIKMRPTATLSLIHESDSKAFAIAALNSRSLHRRWSQPPLTAAKVAELASNRHGPSDYGYIIRDGATGSVAGYIEITGIVRGLFQSAYLGYYIFNGFERQGYMKWGLGAVLKRAWKEHKLHRLEANIQPDNEASIALVTSLGFKKEGYSSAYLKIAGRWRDHERWAILASKR